MCPEAGLIVEDRVILHLVGDNEVTRETEERIVDENASDCWHVCEAPLQVLSHLIQSE